MGTSNFYYRNTSKVYAVLMTETVINDDTEEEIRNPESWEIEDFIENVQEQFEVHKNFTKLDEWDNNAPYSYPIRKIGEIINTKTFGNTDIGVRVIITLNSGYYEGACFDYTKEILVDGYEYDNIEPDDFNTGNKGLNKILCTHASKWAENQLKHLSMLVENIFAENSKCLKVTATFSNGETIYSLC